MTELQWYEFDRMIIMAIDPEEWEPTTHVITRVMRQCIELDHPMTVDEIITRLVQMVWLGTLALTGNIWNWQMEYSAVSVVIWD